MKCPHRSLVAAVACFASSMPAVAYAQIVTGNTCPVEYAQVSVNFNGMETDVSVARSKLDAKIAEVKELAQAQQFTKLVIQSHNYNISTAYNGMNGGDPRYRYNASISFSIQPSEKAVDFMQMLAKKGYQTNVNVNSYNGGNCGTGMGAGPGVER